MCGRYSITTPVEGLRRLFRFAGPLPNLRPRYNVAPTQQVPIVRTVRNDKADHELTAMKAVLAALQGIAAAETVARGDLPAP